MFKMYPIFFEIHVYVVYTVLQKKKNENSLKLHYLKLKMKVRIKLFYPKLKENLCSQRYFRERRVNFKSLLNYICMKLTLNCQKYN